jgi:hypothetical protein|tara:strand:- start:1384 stop:1929 length:546 start_codon:yes stop_codon:yes gene_type:complete
MKNKTQKKKDNRKITIKVDWNSTDSGYSHLQNKKILLFLTNNINAGYNLIQTQPNTSFNSIGKTTLHLQAVKCKQWPLKVKWDDSDKDKEDEKTPLICTSYSDWIKVTPCGIGKKRQKIFLKFKSNEYIAGFGTYLWRLFSGEIDIKKHKHFVKAIKTTFKNKEIIIHNEDVSWFHMKELI